MSQAPDRNRNSQAQQPRPGIADQIKQTRDLATNAPADGLRNALEKHRLSLAKALPAGMTTDSFISAVIGAAGKNPDILLCEPTTVMQSVGQAARMGLSLEFGHGFLVPYNDNRKGIKICQFVPGWMGLVDLVNRSGRGVVSTGAVFDGDFFDYDKGTNPFIRHRNEGDEAPDKLIKVYAQGHIRGEGGWNPPPIIEVWSIDKVRRHLHQYNKVGDRHYALKGANNFEMYARKVPLLQVLKYMPKTPEIARAVAAINKVETGESMTLDGDFIFPMGEGGGGDAGGGDAGGGAGGPPQGDDAPKPTYAQLADRITKAKDRDSALLILDQCRHLVADQQKELLSFVNDKFPPA